MIWVLFILLGAPLTLVLHELAHLFVVKLAGATIVEFAPWPDFRRPRGQRLGVVRYRMPAGTLRPPESSLAPFIKAVALFSVWGGLGVIYHPLWALAAWEALDAGVWVYHYARETPGKYDGARWRRHCKK